MMKSFDILDRQVEVRGDHFLEASAGTGKTFAIEHIFSRLILEGEDPLTVDQILVVTFTRAATRELKSRVRANLETLLQRTDIDYVEALLQGGEKKAKRRRDAALASFDQAHIFTIHGFCHRMLREFAFEAGVALQLSDPEGSDVRAAMLQVVDDFYRTGLKPSAYSPRQLHILLAKHQHQVSKLSARLVSAMGNRAAPSESADFSQSLEAFRTFLREHPSFDLLRETERLMPSYKRMTLPAFLAQAAHLEQLMAKRSCSGEEFEKLLKHKEFFLEKMAPGNLKVRAQIKNAERIEALREQVIPILAEARDPNKIFARLLRECQNRWQRHPELTPDELLAKMEKCLDRPDFVLQVRRKYRAVIVDEFQDTDPIQWKIFERLFLGHTAALYLVGDPKQSIYAFRKADVYTYLDAKQRIDPEGHGALDTNYRSAPALVSLLNRLFQKAGDWMLLPALKQTLAVNPVKTRPGHEEKEAGDGKQPIHFFLAEGEVEELFFRFIAEEVQQFALSSCAVLVKDRYQAGRLRAFLKQWGIGSVVKRTGSLRDSFAWEAMQELVRAVQEPDRLSRIKQVLGGPFIGFGLDRLIPGRAQEELQLAKARFVAFRELLQESGFAAFYRAFLDSAWEGKTVLEKLVEGQDLTFYRHVQQLAELLAQGREILELDAEDEELKIRPEEDEEAVAILTVHMSKGLEFEVVFALGVAMDSPAEEEEIEAEKMRQLYVALTRAKERLYVPLPLRGDGATPIEIFCQKLGGEPASVLQELNISYTLLNLHPFHLKKVERREAPVLSCPKPPLIAAPPQLLLSFSSLSQKGGSEGPFAWDASIPSPGLPPGAETGTLLHRILEKMFLAKQERKALILSEIQGTHLEGWEASIEEMLQAVFALPLNGFTLADLSPQKLHAEMEFLFSIQGGMLKGFIDLFFEKEGIYYLADWKSNLLSGYEPADLQQAMEENDYFLQGEIYAQALKRYLSLLDPRPFEECFGGIFYVFLRGPAVYRFIPGNRSDLCGKAMP